MEKYAWYWIKSQILCAISQNTITNECIFYVCLKQTQLGMKLKTLLLNSPNIVCTLITLFHEEDAKLSFWLDQQFQEKKNIMWPQKTWLMSCVKWREKKWNIIGFVFRYTHICICIYTQFLVLKINNQQSMTPWSPALNKGGAFFRPQTFLFLS